MAKIEIKITHEDDGRRITHITRETETGDQTTETHEHEGLTLNEKGRRQMKQEVTMKLNHAELDEYVEDEAVRLSIELDNSMTYAEQAEFLEQEAANPKNHDDAASLAEMASILRDAEIRWFELED